MIFGFRAEPRLVMHGHLRLTWAQQSTAHPLTGRQLYHPMARNSISSQIVLVVLEQVISMCLRAPISRLPIR